MQTSLPDYAKRLRLQHEAFGPDFEAAFRRLFGASRPQSVADIACGDGGFTRMLARIFGDADVVGFDVDDDFLRSARKQTRIHNVRFEQRDVLKDDAELERHDIVFCADSFQSIDDHRRLLDRMQTMLRPGGHLIVTETDNLHDLILSVEPELELQLRTRECEQQSGSRREGWVFPRHVTGHLRSLRFEAVRFDTVTANRVGPLDDATARWLRQHLRDRLQTAEISSSSDIGSRLHPDGCRFIGGDPDVTLTFLRYVAIGRRPVDDSPND